MLITTSEVVGTLVYLVMEMSGERTVSRTVIVKELVTLLMVDVDLDVSLDTQDTTVNSVM